MSILWDCFCYENPVVKIRDIYQGNRGNDSRCYRRKIYVIAFWDSKIFKKFSDMLLWETEEWIADISDYMIYLNGDKFLEHGNRGYLWIEFTDCTPAFQSELVIVLLLPQL